MKNYCVRFLSLSYLLLFSFLNPTFATNGIGLGPISNNGGGNQYFGVDSLCDLRLELYIYLTYLEVYPPNNPASVDFYFPSTHDPMFVALTVGNNPTEMILLDEFIWDGNIGGVNYYYSNAISPPINLADECMESDSNDEIVIDVDMKLMTLGSNQEFIPYPACDHIYGRDIFSCNVLWVEAENCTPSVNCNNTVLTESLIPVVISCENCPGLGAGRSWDSASENQLSTTSAQPISVNPNPFTDRLLVNCGGEDQIQKVELYDLSGKKIYQQIIQEKEVQELEVNVLDVPAGLYLVKVQTAESTETFKVFKAS